MAPHRGGNIQRRCRWTAHLILRSAFLTRVSKDELASMMRDDAPDSATALPASSFDDNLRSG
jgi:hypothetical protein